MSTAQTATMLSARGLMKSFGAVKAADNVNIEIPTGQRVSLIGSNGAGKTTFVNMVTGYLKPDAGTIELDGKAIAGLGPRLITRMGVARSFQIPQLALDMTALDNMLVAASCNDGHQSFWKPAHAPHRIERAMELLARFELADHAHRKVSELPGGVRKLLDIAMALTGSPKLLLLDEPTSGVSVDEKFPMMDTISAALASERVTVLFVEHDMEIVTRYSDRVIAFYSGRVIADDPPSTVLDDPEVQRYVTGSLKQGH
jgi:branched-chain amino acid transport system ATP-binding protein